jgi:hypothetical protein
VASASGRCGRCGQGIFSSSLKAKFKAGLRPPALNLNARLKLPLRVRALGAL